MDDTAARTNIRIFQTMFKIEKAERPDLLFAAGIEDLCGRRRLLLFPCAERRIFHFFAKRLYVTQFYIQKVFFFDDIVQLFFRPAKQLRKLFAIKQKPVVSDDRDISRVQPFRIICYLSQAQLCRLCPNGRRVRSQNLRQLFIGDHAVIAVQDCLPAHRKIQPRHL